MKLWKHQREAVRRSKESYALFMEEGTGKTYTYLAIAKKFSCSSILIICPKSLVLMWTGILEREGAHYGLQEHRVCSVDYAGRHCLELSKGSWDIIVVDEASKIKRHQSRRSKGICKLSRLSNARIRLLGTGTPFGNAGGYEIFTYAKFLFPTASHFGTSFYKFQREYYEEVDDWDWEPRDDTFERFQVELDRWSYRCRKSECFDLPEKVYKRHDLRKLKGASKKIYTALRRDTLALLSSGTVVRTPAKAIRLNKMQQICAGILYGHKAESWMEEVVETIEIGEDGLDNPKLEWLGENLPEMLAEKSGDVMIVATYTEVLNYLTHWMIGHDIPYAQYYGDHRDQLDGPWRVLLANQTTIAFGHNLQRLSHIIFFTNPWKLEERRQTENRAHRAGQKRKVTIHDLVLFGSIDGYILDCLRSHSNIAKIILRDFGKEF